MTDDLPQLDPVALKREINRIGWDGYAVVRARGTPQLDEVARRLRWKGSLVDLLRAGLERLGDGYVPSHLMLVFWEVDVDKPRPHDDRLRTLTSSLSAELPKPSGGRRREGAVRTEFRLPTERELVGALLAMVEERGASPGLIEVEEETRQGLTALVSAAALQLIVECNDHGAWPGSPDERSSPRLSLSVSCWAVAALSKVFGEPVRPWVERTHRCVIEKYDRHYGAVGELAYRKADTRPFRDARELRLRPRLTASAVKLMRMKQGRATMTIGRCIDYLLRTGEDGWWNELTYPGDTPGNVTTTVYVLDALQRMKDDKVPDELKDEYELSRDVLANVAKNFEKRLDSGFALVANEQDPDTGAWTEEPDGTPSPYVAAHVVGFLWQLLHERERVLERTLGYLERTQRKGGYPEVDGGDPAIAPTAMIVNGLLRIAKLEVATPAERALAFLGACADPEELPRLGAFAATFVLLLGMPQYEEHGLLEPGWREPVIEAIKAFGSAPKRRDTTPEQLADATVAPLGAVLSGRVRPALLDILSEPKPAHA